MAADAFLVAWRRLDDLPDQTGDARAWLVPGDELENAVGEGVEAEVTYRDGTSGTATLGLGTG